MVIGLPRMAAVKRGAGPNSPRLTAEVSNVSTQPAPISMSACRVEVGSATRCSRFTPRRISARVASIGTPEDSRGTTTIAPSGMAATASSILDATMGIVSSGHSGAPRSGEPGIHNHETRDFDRSVVMGSGLLAPLGPATTTTESHLPLDIVLLHHRSPQFALRGGERAQLLRRRQHQAHLLAFGERLRDTLLADRGGQLLVEALHRGLRRAGRREHAPP